LAGLKNEEGLHMLKSLALFSCVLTFVGNTPLGAQEPVVLYNTFGPGDIYDYGTGFSVSGHDSRHGDFMNFGFAFVPSTTATLDTIQVAFGGMDSTNNNTIFTLSLQAANGPLGGPGDLIETFLVTEFVGPFGFRHPLITLRSRSRPLLNAATAYWLVATAHADNWVGWNANVLNAKGRFYSIQLDRVVLLEDRLQAAFRVNGIPFVDNDADNDGVDDSIDECPDTPPGVVVSSTGCSIEQLVPCDGPWRNHGQYVSAVVRTARAFAAAGLITAEQQGDIIEAAARSNCGKPRRPPVARENGKGRRVSSPPLPNRHLPLRR
jgi:hypothetical protein